MTTWPIGIQPSHCSWSRDRTDGFLESPTTRARQIVRRGRPLWKASITWGVKPEDVSEVRYQIESLKGGAGSVKLHDFASIILPTPAVPLLAAASVGATSISTSGWPVSTTGVVIAGQYLEVAELLYLVAATANSDGSGQATITLTTPLLAAASIGALAVLIRPGCQMRIDSQDWSGARTADGALWSVNGSFVEKVTSA